MLILLQLKSGSTSSITSQRSMINRPLPKLPTDNHPGIRPPAAIIPGNRPLPTTPQVKRQPGGQRNVFVVPAGKRLENVSQFRIKTSISGRSLQGLYSRIYM